MAESDQIILSVLETLASIVLEMYGDFIRLREAVLADDLARQKYSVGFGEKRFLALEQRAREVLELIRQTREEASSH